MAENVGMHEAIELLRDARSPKRRSGARRLRKLGNSEAGAALLAALHDEIRDPRTWETQYQIIMALGECGYTAALPYLEELATQAFEATMVSVALGDAIVRLGRSYSEDATPVTRLIGTGNLGLIEGALQAVAMLHLRLNEAAVDQVVAFASAQPRPTQRHEGESIRRWTAAAAAGWKSPAVLAFLNECLPTSDQQLQRAVMAALQGKYVKWSPL